jgi:(E)-4-hydroxy-3-methylbut-2-enyl-diphosphate synthase
LIFVRFIGDFVSKQVIVFYLSPNKISISFLQMTAFSSEMGSVTLFLPYQFCIHLLEYHRIATQSVRIGELYMGGEAPIRVQSMTIADTMDTQATVQEAIEMIQAGCELVRVTAPSQNEAQNLANIKAELRQLGYNTPLVADIHFTPKAAEIAAKIVEKVRINPGNFVDKKKFELHEYTDESYSAELIKIRDKFIPLVELCKAHGTAMRIGTNHGSLSDRIMSRYGDTPEGMVASALEFIDICEEMGFDQLVISMKAANPIVMIAAYRLLSHHLLKRGKYYPIHLGVTEAGDGEDGRIKSALGIAALLIDGIGDTVRVSLTEPAQHEMPVARAIIKHIERHYAQSCFQFAQDTLDSLVAYPFNPYEFNRAPTAGILNFGAGQVPRVISDFRAGLTNELDLTPVGHIFNAELDKWNMTDFGTDYIYLADKPLPFMLPNGVRGILDSAQWAVSDLKQYSYPYFDSIDEFMTAIEMSAEANFVRVDAQSAKSAFLESIISHPVVFVVEPKTNAAAYEYRYIILTLKQRQITNPIVLKLNVTMDESDFENSLNSRFQIAAACDSSIALADGLIDGLWLVPPKGDLISPAIVNRTAFNLLQASRQRITKTEYISCPSCGRTLFDLQETTARIRAQTEHLKGVKIAVMGCIVNGPGEMADADYGYVGSGVDQISLYRGKEMVEKGVKTAFAVDKLIDIIRADGNWIEPEYN